MSTGPPSAEHFLTEEVSPQVFATPLSDELAAAAVERLKAEADRHWGIDPRRSLEFAGRILAIGRARGDDRQVALGMMARGDALKFLGRTTEAWEALDEAGRLFRSVGDEVGWARTCIGRLYLSTMLNRVQPALAEAGLARLVFLRHGEHEKLLRLEIQTAYVLNDVGEPRAALERFRSALATAEELGPAGLDYFGILYANLGSTYEALGELRQARDYYERARARFTAEGEALHLATVETNLAYLAQAQGNYRLALRMLHHTLEGVAGLSDLEAAKLKWHLLECYQGLSRLAEARELAHQLVADYRRLEDALELGRVLLKLGAVEAELSHLDAALAALDEAEDIFTSLDAAPWLAAARLRRGRVALRQGLPALALAQARAATTVFETSGQRANLAQAILLQGQAFLGLDDLPAAAASGWDALQAARRDHLPSQRYSAHLLLGRVFERSEHFERARQHFAAAAAVTDRLQRGLTITLRPGFLEDKAEAWRALIGLHLRAGRAGLAFETLERAKSQVLLGYLSNRERLRWAQDNEYSRRLIAELDGLRAEHQWFYRLAHAVPQEGSHPSPVSPQVALAEVKALERRMRQITERLYLHGAEGRPASPAPAFSTGDLQRFLPDDALLVEYYNDGEQLWAFTLDRGSVEVHRLPLAAQALNPLLIQLQVNLAAALKLDPQALAAGSLTRLVRRVLHRLYSGLLEPLEARLAGRQRLLIVPYGGLHYLPFHLLYTGSAYLIERQEVVILPAAGLVAEPGPQRPPGARILAHSWDGRLPHTHHEGELVQGLFGGELFADAQARRELFSARPGQILHIAAHGQFRLDQPDFSFIQLADGQLYADDLLQHDLSYELVTLSACETGRANVAGGEELIGLGRGFLYAGAGALVLSLWPVPDAATLRLMEGLYRALRAGASKAAALRLAQRSLLAEDSDLHPAFWGAFQLVGNAGPLSGLVG